MEAVITGLIFVLALLGVPLFAVFGGASMAFFGVEDREGSINFAGAEFFTHRFADSPLTVTIPLFIFAGYILAESGTPTRLVRLSRAWLGWMPGGLAIVCIFASAFFTTFTGGSGITIVAIGGLLLPALLAERYNENFSLGLVTTGGSLGLLFPPSLPLILYAIVGGISITKLFVAGILPGILTVVVLVAYAVFIGKRSKMPRTKFDGKEAFASLREAIWEILLPVVLVFGLILGILRIHEAAAFAASYALIIEVWVYKDVSFRKDLPRIIRDSMTMFGAILVILATAIGFTGYLIDARVPDLALDALEQFIASPGASMIVLSIMLAPLMLILFLRKHPSPTVVKWSKIIAYVDLVLIVAVLTTGILINLHVFEPPDALVGFLSGPIVFLLMLNIFLLIVGMLMDVFSAIVVVVPLVLPIAEAMGINKYHLAIVFLLNLEIGYLTPPVGLNLFISSLRFEKPVTQLYRAVVPFIGLLLVALVITTYVPLVVPGLFPTDEGDNLMEETPDTPVGDPDDETNELLEDIMGGDDGGDDFTLDDLGDDDFTLDDLGDDGDFTLDDLGDDAVLDEAPPEEEEDDGVFTLDDLGDDAILDDSP